MSRQNRLNAGAEYVLCRLWATLQDRGGIHPESLLACLGALAGYACQVSARRTPASRLPGQNLLLMGTPVSVCALVGRAVQKLGKPQPDIDEIFRHVTQTLGAGEFGAPRVPPGHCPRHLPIVYVKQIWPQILPIAQPFCRRPAQLPVLFGIAIQRAIELTQDILNPTLGASIAMECAVAMSKVRLPGTSTEPAVIPPTITAVNEVDPPPALAREPPSARRKKKIAEVAGGSAYNTWHLVERLAPARNAITIAALAIVAMAGTMWSTDRGEPPQVAREARLAQLPVPRNDLPAPDESPSPEPPPIEEMQVVVARNDPPVTEEVDAPAPMPEQPSNEGIIAEDGESSFESSPGGEMAASALAIES